MPDTMKINSSAIPQVQYYELVLKYVKEAKAESTWKQLHQQMDTMCKLYPELSSAIAIRDIAKAHIRTGVSKTVQQREMIFADIQHIAEIALWRQRRSEIDEDIEEPLPEKEAFEAIMDSTTWVDYEPKIRAIHEKYPDNTSVRHGAISAKHNATTNPGSVIGTVSKELTEIYYIKAFLRIQESRKRVKTPMEIYKAKKAEEHRKKGIAETKYVKVQEPIADAEVRQYARARTAAAATQNHIHYHHYDHEPGYTIRIRTYHDNRPLYKRILSGWF